MAIDLITPETAAEYRERSNRYAAWSEQYRKPNGWTVIPADHKPPAGADISNDERGALEQFEIFRDKPERLFAYVSFHEREIASRFSDAPRNGRPSVGDEARVTVWTGRELGRGRVNRVYRSGFGDWRASVGVVIAGETYSGMAPLDSGTYVRLRKLKAKPAKESRS